MSADMEYIKKSGRLYWRANEVLRYKIAVPKTENEAVDGFYLNIASACEGFCTKKLYPMLRERGIGYRYEMICRVTHCDGEVISVAMRARLLSGKNVIYKFVDAKSWEAEEEQMIPPKQLRLRFGSLEQKRQGDNKIFLINGGLQSLSSMDEALIFG